jgi:hypothetical protein
MVNFQHKLSLGAYIAEVFYNLKYYFFESVAFKINAKKPAGINQDASIFSGTLRKEYQGHFVVLFHHFLVVLITYDL